jgi:hypothetical protein
LKFYTLEIKLGRKIDTLNVEFEFFAYVSKLICPINVTQSQRLTQLLMLSIYIIWSKQNIDQLRCVDNISCK